MIQGEGPVLPQHEEQMKKTQFTIPIAGTGCKSPSDPLLARQ